MKTLTFKVCILKVCFKVLKNCYHTVAISHMFWKWNFIKNSIIFFKIREVNDIIYHLLLFFINYSNIFTNSEMSNRMIKKYCPLSSDCKTLMENLIANLGLSARAFSRVVKLSRTIADIEQCEQIMPKHIMEAAGYRFLDKSDWF